MNTEKKKMSNAKIIALVVSVALHGALAYYLGNLALDYALPKGEVSSLEMNFETPQGVQIVDTTKVDIVETLPPPPAPPKPKAVAPKPVAAPKAIPKTLPTKEPVVEDKQGEMPVATEIPEDTHKELVEETPQVEPPKEEPTQEVAQDAPPEIIPVPQAEPTSTAQEAVAAAPAAPTATEQGYGTPVGEQTESLIPFGSNKSHTYPYMGRLRKLEGVSVVQYTVAPTGEVTEAKLMQSSGHSVLDSEAIDAIKKWKFKPMKNEVVYEKEVIFRLKGEAKAAPSQLRRIGK